MKKIRVKTPVSSMEFHLLPDRYPTAELKIHFPAAALNLQKNVVMEGETALVAYVGIAFANAQQCVMFLPHGSPDDENDRLRFASKLMNAIALFGHHFSRPSDDGMTNAGLSSAAILHAIALDYRQHGIYSERLSVKTRNNGKTLWPETIKQEIPFISRDGVPVYLSTRTHKPQDDSRNIIAVLQSILIREIYIRHSWWLGDTFGDRKPPVEQSQVPWPREAGPSLLAGARTAVFADRPLHLCRLLIAYLENQMNNGPDSLLLGVSDFSTVWEKMLARTLPGFEDAWNAKLPVPTYIDSKGHLHRRRPMMMDAVVRHDNKLKIIDAKYYDAQSPGRLPNTPDIVKQLFYQQALESIMGPNKLKISNAFAFPKKQSGSNPFQTVSMYNVDGTANPHFEQFDCLYLSMHEVVEAFISGGQLMKERIWPELNI